LIGAHAKESHGATAGKGGWARSTGAAAAVFTLDSFLAALTARRFEKILSRERRATHTPTRPTASTQQQQQQPQPKCSCIALAPLFSLDSRAGSYSSLRV
jgi:hypothetical protein